jgi:hypothetical protein
MVRGVVNVAIFGALGVLSLVLGTADHNDLLRIFGILALAFALLGALALSRLPQIRRSVAGRLVGATRVTLSDHGIEYAGATVAERIEWSRVQRLYDRPDTWVILTKVPVATIYIPRAAVPPQLREQFVNQVMDGLRVRTSSESGNPLPTPWWRRGVVPSPG